MFDNSVLFISGGTGSFGNAVLKRFIDTPIKEIRIFSRDEKKQDDLRKKYQNSKIKFYLGDVRDPDSVNNALKGVDYVFHAAALKQVPSCEFFPMQAVKTNVIGTDNVTTAAIANGVKRLICLSTDKAVSPVNAMGMSKALMEKIVVAKSRQSEGTVTTVCCTRYGNVLASRGSVVPLFLNQVLAGQPITITNPEMTRFMMTLDDAVDLVIHAFKNGSNGDIFVQKAPAATITTIAKAVIRLLDKPENYPIEIIGTRHGEKKHEALLNVEEYATAVDQGNYFRIAKDARDLNYTAYFEEGKILENRIGEYSSDKTRILTVDELVDLLRPLNLVEREGDVFKQKDTYD